jgi:hypothetical protein
MKNMFRILLMVLLPFFAVCSTAIAQISFPASGDLLVQVSNGAGGFQSRYIDTNKTGALQILMYGQDPTPGAPAGQLRPQQRTLGTGVVCGAAAGSPCNFTAAAGTVDYNTLLNLPDLSVYATNSALSAYVTGSSLSSTLGNYVTSSSLSSTLSGYATAASLNNYATTSSLTNYALNSALSNYALNSALSSYATTSALGSGLATKQDKLAGTTSQYVRGDGSTATFPTIPAAQLPADWAATSGPTMIISKPTSCAGYGITDCVTPTSLSTTLSGYPTSASLTTTLSNYATTASVTSSLAGYVSNSALSSTLGGYATTGALTSGLAGKFSTPTGTTSQYLRGDGSLATLPTTVPFNFSDPVARTVNPSTTYQATNTAKAAIVSVSVSCTNSSTLVAASACTVQVRQSPTSGLTCSNGVVSKTWTSTVPLGLVFSQTSGSPLEINVPIGAYFILCPTAGTFTATASEQIPG